MRRRGCGGDVDDNEVDDVVVVDVDGVDGVDGNVDVDVVEVQVESRG